MKKNIEVSIYGDNILECERMYGLIKEGFQNIKNEIIDLSHIYAPLKIIETNDVILHVQFYPDYKSKTRWFKQGLLNVLVENGANLTEASDIILTNTINGFENILLSIEFSSALPAGNQAWQRSGRALSFSEVGIPYLYINDIGLEELDSDRESKAERSSNPLVPLSYIKHTNRVKSFTLSVLNPSQLLKKNELNKEYLVGNEVVSLINSIIFERDISAEVDSLNRKTANYISSFKEKSEAINFGEWIKLDDSEIEKYISDFNLPDYKKKIAEKTPVKDSMRILIKELIPKHAISIFNNIPICIVTSSNRKAFKDDIIQKCYPKLSSEVISWLDLDGPLVICLINGFKPKGDDARPDRGLVPFARMLFGFEIDLMAIVFGQAPAEMGALFKSNSYALAEKNGLWKSILYYSSLTLADSFHWDLKDQDKTSFTLSKKGGFNPKGIVLKKPSRIPIKFNENDIDTAIHLTFSSKKEIFEGLCNPPGGDWSGISLVDINQKEHRWMSLPRLSVNVKRPDHIFQITCNDKNYLLIVESKETLSGLLKDKENLGEGLIKYVDLLTVYPSSAIKSNGEWKRNDDKTAFTQCFTDKFSAVAFIYVNIEDLLFAKNNLQVDLIIGLNVQDKTLEYIASNSKGSELITVLKAIGIS
jgi:hypothetical protein